MGSQPKNPLADLKIGATDIAAELGAHVLPLVSPGAGEAVAARAALDELPESPFDTFEVVVVDRRSLVKAPYYARDMAADARLALGKGIKKVGMVGPTCAVNKRTGNIVGGVQRLERVDFLMQTPRYKLKVAIVDLPIELEVSASILLNNGEAQGFFDLGRLGEAFRTYDIDLEASGFTMATVYQLFGDSPFREAPAEDLNELAERLQAARREYELIGEKAKSRDDTGFYTVLVFADCAQRAAFHESFGFDDNRYQDGLTLRRDFAEFMAWRAERQKNLGAS